MSALARQRSDLKSIDTTNLTTGQKGDLGEARTALTMQKAGYTEMPARLARNNGFDGVWVKYNTDGSIKNIIITETKFSSTRKASMANTKSMGKQLSNRWIRENIRKMRKSDDPSVVETARILRNYSNPITKKAALVTPDGNQRFNKIKKPSNDE